MNPELEQFLSLTSAVGLVESEGEFTVDLGRALESLNRFTLHQPETYFRYLVASAVARDATYVKLETSARALTIRDDGRPLEFAELKATFPSLMSRQTHENAAQRLLGIGLCGARGLGFSTAEVSNSKGVLRFVKDRLEVHEEPGDNETVIRIAERRTLTKVLSHLVKKDGWKHLEAGSRCLSLAPARITIDGVDVGRPHPCESGQVWKIESDIGVPKRTRDVLGSSLTTLPYFGYIETQFRGGIPLSFVVHGITFEEENPEHGFGGVVICDDLKLDASFLGLVTDQQLENIRLDLAKHADKALLASLHRWEDFPDAPARLLHRVTHCSYPREWLARLADVSVAESGSEPFTFSDMRESVREFGLLRMEIPLNKFEPVMRFFFPSLLKWGLVTSLEARELLGKPSFAVLKFPGQPVALRWEPERPEQAFECLCFETKETPLGMHGPRGFQFVALQPEATIALGFSNFDRRILQLGTLVFRYIALGILEQSETSDFFLSLLEWGLRNHSMSRKDIEIHLNCLSFRTEGGEPVDFASLRAHGTALYTVEEDELSGSPTALRLSVREFEVLFNSGSLTLYHAIDYDNSEPWSPR